MRGCRYSHLIESKAFAISSFRKRAGVLYLWKRRILVLMGMKLLWMLRFFYEGTLVLGDNRIHVRRKSCNHCFCYNFDERVDEAHRAKVAYIFGSVLLWDQDNV